jgi:basic membrane protein A
MPVAGPVGFGSLQAVKEKGNAWIIGVDTDWTLQQPDAKNVILTSVLKNIDVAVMDTIKVAMDPAFKGFNGENYVGTLENGGVGLAGVADGAISADVLKELDQVKADIISGKINTGWADYLKTLGN